MSSRTVGAYFMTDEAIHIGTIVQVGSLSVTDDGKLFCGAAYGTSYTYPGPLVYDPVRKGFYKLTVDRRNGERRKP